MSGEAPDFFAALARKAVQAPSLQPRRASRFEEVGATGPVRSGAEPASLAESGADDGLGAVGRGQVPQRGSGEAAPRPPGPVTQASLGVSTSTVHAEAPGELDRAQRAASAPAFAALAQKRLNAEASLSWPQETRPAEAAEPMAGRRPALEGLHGRDAALELAAPQAESPVRWPQTALPSRLPDMAELDRSEPAANEDQSARRGLARPSVESLNLQPLDAMSMPRGAALPPPVERREPAAAAQALHAQAPAPQIEIHIGRIEVLPAGAPAPAAIQQPNQTQPRAPQSLESYLAERRRT